MNIFYLDENPVLCAKQHCDSHVSKMCVEYAQLLSTTYREHTPKSKSDELEIYKVTMPNHPSTKWVRQSYKGYEWLLALFSCLLQEYEHRYNRQHSSGYLLEYLSEVPKYLGEEIEEEYKSSGKPLKFTPPTCAMERRFLIGLDGKPFTGVYTQSNENKVDVKLSYQNYYREGKKHILHYTNRERPDWL